MRGPDDTVQTARRFYKAVEVKAEDNAFTVRLDGRPPKSPGGLALTLPTRGLAELVAGEWAAQAEFIRLAEMPATRLAFTALEKAAPVREGLADEVARFAGSDALCYFADAPASLVARQNAVWGPLLDWAETTLGLSFHRAVGVLHRQQPPETLARVKALAAGLDDFSLIGLVHATALFGSAILALALQRDHLSGLEAYEASSLEERFQEEQWGPDAEAIIRTERRRDESQMLDRWFAALR
ncbi:MAG: ATPase [Caulobacter sp.]|nr:ATPase [Caulobacter sp.]